MKTQSQAEHESLETIAQRAGMDAFMVALIKALKGAQLTELLGTTHEHVGVMKLSNGMGLRVNVRVEFTRELLSAQEVQALEFIKRPV